MKKLLTSLLCVMMVVCFMPAMAWADGEESVSSLPEAVDGVITLDSGKVYEVGASALTPGDTTPVIEVDLQGSTLIVDGTIEFSGSNKVLTIKDSSASKGTLKFTEKTDPSNADMLIL